MSEPNPELLLLDFVQVVLARPRTYTINGSYYEVLAFIHDYHVGHRPSGTHWFDFIDSERRDGEHADHVFLRVRQRCSDDTTAIRELKTLYNAFLQRKVD